MQKTHPTSCYNKLMEKPENSTILNICVLPSEEASAAYEAISQSLGSNGTMFTLGGDKFAHMTVFMARFADDVIDQVITSTEQALKPIDSFECEHTGYFMTEGRYLEASYRKSSAFMGLHEALIATLANLRINPGNPYEEGYFTPYTLEQQQNAKETGYDLARNLYRPHVTLTRYEEGHVPQLFPAFPETNLSFTLSKVCVYKADDNGAVYEKLAEFSIN